MNVNIDWDKLSDEKKKEFIKALGDGLVFLVCRKLQIDYFELKKKLGL
jgi:hypothetical protein